MPKSLHFIKNQKHLRRNGTVLNIHVRSIDHLELQMALNGAKILTDKISTQQYYKIFQDMSFVRNLKRLPRLRLDIIWSQNANSALHHKLKSDRDLYFWEAVRSIKDGIDVFRCASISWFQVVSKWTSERFTFFQIFSISSNTSDTSNKSDTKIIKKVRVINIIKIITIIRIITIVTRITIVNIIKNVKIIK